MGVTSSGLLDEELVSGADSTNEVADTTLTVSGEKNAAATAVIGRDVAGSNWVNFMGPCIYALP